MSDEELLKEIEQKCDEIRNKKFELVQSQDYQQVAELYGKENELKDRWYELRTLIAEEEAAAKPPPKPYDSWKDVRTNFKRVNEKYQLAKRTSKLEKSAQDLKEAVTILAERIDRLDGKKPRKRAL